MGLIERWRSGWMILESDASSRPLWLGVITHPLGRLLGFLPCRQPPADFDGLILEPGGSVHTLGMGFSLDVLFVDRHQRLIRRQDWVMPNRFVFAPAGTRAVIEVVAGRLPRGRIQPELGPGG
ncbi:DUF192 domain-containing protein [Spiribacter pallidus]|uniref:hypothetical protein n=1 Tax=Spiribacter pallidus TaxID=1987936 RepID=UPI00349FE24C